MRYFVTGATGFIGGRLVRLLRERGDDVTALVRDPSRATDLADLGVRLHGGDVTDRASLSDGMGGADGVFHLAAWYKVGARDASTAERINVVGTRNVLETMRDLKIPRGVYTSTLAVYSDTGGRVVDESYYHPGPWLSEYDRTKWLAHYEVALPLARAGLPLVIVQPGVVYGPGDGSAIHDLFVQFLKRTLPMVPEGAAYCWAHVDDTARGHLLAMERGRPGECYHLSGPPHTVEQALAIAERITGISAPRLRASRGMLRASAGFMRVIERLVPVPETYASETLRVAAGVTYLGSSEKAQRELGFRARPLEEGLRETLLSEMQLLGLPLPPGAAAVGGR